MSNDSLTDPISSHMIYTQHGTQSLSQFVRSVSVSLEYTQFNPEEQLKAAMQIADIKNDADRKFAKTLLETIISMNVRRIEVHKSIQTIATSLDKISKSLSEHK